MKVSKYYYITTQNNITTVETSIYLMIAKGDVIIEEYDNGDIYIASNKTKISDQYYVDKFAWYQLQATVFGYDMNELYHAPYIPLLLT